MKERLTKWEDNKTAGIIGAGSPIDKIMANAINRLAKLEDKIENGTLIELPCNVGDTFYRVACFLGSYKIITDKVFEFIIRPSINMENRKILICNSMGASFWLGDNDKKVAVFMNLLHLINPKLKRNLQNL